MSDRPDGVDRAGPQKGFTAKLDAGSVTVDRRDIEMLGAIDRTGSLHAAADALGRSYARIQRRVDELEAAVGTLTHRRRGGPDGGGTELTENAHELRRRFARHEAALEGLAEAPESVLQGRVTSRSGELASVETAAGTILAIVAPGPVAVEVTVRADAVVLLARGDADAGVGTSLRNRFLGTVDAIARAEGTALVSVALDGGETLLATVTMESLHRLDLAVGSQVVASFKATAARATRMTGSPSP